MDDERITCDFLEKKARDSFNSIFPQFEDDPGMLCVMAGIAARDAATVAMNMQREQFLAKSAPSQN
jgi:hypothetical protein